MQNKISLSFLLSYIKKIFSKDTALLVLFLIGAGLLSVWLAQDLTHDFLMYHYYNGFAFLNNRLTLDIAPAQIATYYNPLLDAVLYILDNTFSKNPFLFVMGLPAGLALFIIYKIADLFFDDHKKIWIPVSLLISLTGFAFFRQIGTCTHEITLACFVLGAVYILLKNPIKPIWYFIAGALLGAAAGFKLTAALYCISTGITLILFYKTLVKPKTFISLFIFGGLTGFLAIDGFWMGILWKNFQNPFFPFWNRIFKSPYFFDVNYVDDLHLSYDWKKLLFLPFLIFSGNIYNPGEVREKYLVAGITFSDARWMFGFLLLCAFSIKLLNSAFRHSVSRRTFFIISFMVLSYLVWLFSSQNIRFTVPIEMLFGIIFIKVLSLYSLPKSLFKQTAAGVFVCLFFFILLTSPFFSHRWGVYYRSSVPNNAVFPKNALILTAGSPNSYFAAKFAERTNAPIINALLNPIQKTIYLDFADQFFVKQRKNIIDHNLVQEIFIVNINRIADIEIEKQKCVYLKNNPLQNKIAICSNQKLLNNIFKRK
ncbi:MAG: hypothetical protein IJ752_04515 [Alphaproteobacteria bacterium]|nr:hypothetical protein [Alphaproteobacteria bacterium]